MSRIANDACPTCGSELYEVIDYLQDYEYDAVSCWWRCKCPKCHTQFDIDATFRLYARTVTPIQSIKRSINPRNAEEGTYKGETTFCPCNGTDCPYFSKGICHIENPQEDCDDWAAFYESWEDWESLV